MSKNKGNSTDTAFTKAVVLESTIALLKQKAYENLECLVEALLILEIYNSYLTNENFFSGEGGEGVMILHNTKEFEVYKNSHNMNVFILKAHRMLRKFVRSAISLFSGPF